MADCADDLLFDGTGMHCIFPAPRIDNPNTHGTGCTLSSAIACGLAQGVSLVDSVAAAGIRPPSIDFRLNLVTVPVRCSTALWIGRTGMRELRCIPDAKPSISIFSKCKQGKVQRIQGKRLKKSFLSLHSFTLHRCCFTYSAKRRVSKTPFGETYCFCALFSARPMFICLRCCSMPDDQGMQQAHDQECRAYERW